MSWRYAKTSGMKWMREQHRQRNQKDMKRNFVKGKCDRIGCKRRRSTTPYPGFSIEYRGLRNSSNRWEWIQQTKLLVPTAITWKLVAPWHKFTRPSCPHWFFARYHGSTLKLRNRIGHLFIKLLLAIFLRKLPSVWYNHELAPLFLFRCFLLSQKPVCTRWRTREWHRRTFIMLSK